MIRHSISRAAFACLPIGSEMPVDEFRTAHQRPALHQPMCVAADSCALDHARRGGLHIAAAGMPHQNACVVAGFISQQRARVHSALCSNAHQTAHFPYLAWLSPGRGLSNAGMILTGFRTMLIPSEKMMPQRSKQSKSSTTRPSNAAGKYRIKTLTLPPIGLLRSGNSYLRVSSKPGR